MSQFDDFSGSYSVQPTSMSAEAFVAALAASVSHMSGEALKAYVLKTLPLVGHPNAVKVSAPCGNGQFGDH